MYFDRLEKNLIDIIKEEQAKLGFRKEAIRLYYPLSSLNHFFEAEDSEAEMLARLSGFPASLTKKLGNVTVTAKKDRFCFQIFRKTAASMCMSIPMPTNLSAVW